MVSTSIILTFHKRMSSVKGSLKHTAVGTVLGQDSKKTPLTGLIHPILVTRVRKCQNNGTTVGLRDLQILQAPPHTRHILPFRDRIYSKRTLQAKAIDEEHPASTDGRLRLRRLHIAAEPLLTRKDKRHAQLQIFRTQQEQSQIKESALQTFQVIADARQIRTVYDFVGRLGIRRLEHPKTRGALGRDLEQSHQRRLTLLAFHHHSRHPT